MGMPCEVNSILRLQRSQGYPNPLNLHEHYSVQKAGYRILPIDVPIQLVDDNWLAQADIIIHRLSWENQSTSILFEVVRIYELPFSLKSLPNPL